MKGPISIKFPEKDCSCKQSFLLHIPQAYPSAKIQSAYSTTLADLAVFYNDGFGIK